LANKGITIEGFLPIMLRELFESIEKRVWCNIICRNPSKAIPLLANQDLTPVLLPQNVSHYENLLNLQRPSPFGLLGVCYKEQYCIGNEM